MHQVCPLFPFWLLEELRKVNDDRYSRIQYTPIYCFSGHQPYVPILLWNVLTGSLHVSPNSIWYLTSMTISPSSPICNPLQWNRMMMLMFSLQPNGPPEKICTKRSILMGNQVGHWVRNRYTARPQGFSWVLALLYVAIITQWWRQKIIGKWLIVGIRSYWTWSCPTTQGIQRDHHSRQFIRST